MVEAARDDGQPGSQPGCPIRPPLQFKPRDSKTNPSNSHHLRAGSGAPGIRRGSSPSSPLPTGGHPLDLAPAIHLGARYSVGIELVVPRRVERVGHVHAFAVAAGSPPSVDRRHKPCRLGEGCGGQCHRTWTEPASFGFLGSVTSYCRISPVPQQATYRNLSSMDRSMSVTSGGTAPKPCRSGGSWCSSAQVVLAGWSRFSRCGTCHPHATRSRSEPSRF